MHFYDYQTPKRPKRDEDNSYCNSSAVSEDFDYFNDSANKNHDAYLKRGRPRAEIINHLIIEGSSSVSSIR